MSKKLDFLVVNPSTSKVYQKSHEDNNYPAIEPPYLAALTAEFIRNNGYNTKIIDANAENMTVEDTTFRIKEYNPTLTHIVVHGNQPSASSQLIDWVNLLGKNIRKNNINTKIILSGTHPSALPKATLKEEAFDFVSRGDGFYTVLDLLKNKSLDQISGLWYRKNGEVMASSIIDPLIPSKDLGLLLKNAAWDLLPMERYKAHDWHCLDNIDQRKPYASIYTSFGCGLGCIFCCIDAPFNEDGTRKSGIRFRDPKIVVDEIEMLVNRYNVKNLKFIDEMFIFDQRHYAEVAKRIIERGLGEKLNIWAYARVDTVKEGHLELLKKAGFNWLVLGIESGSKHVRSGVLKQINEEKIHNIVNKIKDSGIYVLGNYIFGLPDDDEKSMKATYDLAVELCCERPNFYSAMAYPGSELHRLAQKRLLPLPSEWNIKRALLPEEDGGPGWIGYSQHAYETWPLPTQYLLPEQVLSFRDDALNKYFTSETYVSFISKKFGQRVADIFCKTNAQKPKRLILGD